MTAIFFLWYLAVYIGLLYLSLQDPTIYAFANQHSGLFYALTMFAALVISTGPALVFVRTRPEPKEEAQPARAESKIRTDYKAKTGKDLSHCPSLLDYEIDMQVKPLFGKRVEDLPRRD